ncbi:O-antigen ligase family protein [Candidatus Desantisbacteria bacterium]|nr:O-antigen ligase family protein [Candidatus Desantisbacteria bacterium]
MNEQKIEKYCHAIIEYGFLGLLLVVPLYFDPHASGVFDTTKMTVMRFFSIIILIAWLVKAALIGHPFVRSKLDIPILAFFWTSILSTIFSAYSSTSLVGAYKRHEGLTTTITYILLFFVATNFLHQKRLFKKTVYCLWTVAIFSSIYSIAQRFGMDPTNWASNVSERTVSFFGNPIFLGAYLCMIIPLAFGFFLNREEQTNILPIKKKTKGKTITSHTTKSVTTTPKKTETIPAAKTDWAVWLYGIIICLSSAGEIYAMSRGPWVGLFAAMVLFVIMSGKKILFENRVRLCILGAVVGLIILSASIGPHSIFNRISETVAVKETATGEKKAEITGGAGNRLKIWERSAHIMLDYPVFGIGPDSLTFIYTRYKTLLMERLEGHNVDYDRSHNEFFDIGVMRGFVGLGIYLWLAFAFFFFCWKSYHGMKDSNERLVLLGICCAVLAYHAQSFFAFAVCSFTILFWTLMGMGMVQAGDIIIPQIKKRGGKISFIRYWISGLIISIGIFLFYLAHFPYKADICFREGERAINENNLDRALEMYEQAVKFNPWERHYYGELTFTYYKKAASIPMEDRDKKKEWIQKAFNRTNDAFVLNPNDGYFYNIMGAIYALSYDMDEREQDKQKAFESYKTALRYNIVFAEPHNNMAALYSKLNQYQDAIKEYENVLRIIPDDFQCMATIGDIYFKMGQMDKSIIWQQKALAVNPKLSRAQHRLGEIYFSQGAYASSAICFNHIIEAEPDNVSVHVDLGAALLRGGRIKEAREEFEYVLMREPGNTYVRGILESMAM